MAALTYLLYKPVLKLLKEREEKIAKGVKDAEEAEKALEEYFKGSWGTYFIVKGYKKG